MALSRILGIFLVVWMTVFVSSEWTSQDNADFQRLINNNNNKSGAQLLFGLAESVCKDLAAIAGRSGGSVAASSMELLAFSNQKSIFQASVNVPTLQRFIRHFCGAYQDRNQLPKEEQSGTPTDDDRPAEHSWSVAPWLRGIWTDNGKKTKWNDAETFWNPIRPSWFYENNRDE